MNLYVSTGALVVIGLAVLAGVVVHRWTQRRTATGVPRRRGDLGQAVMAAAAVAAALSTMLLPPGADGGSGRLPEVSQFGHVMITPAKAGD
ncbi:hypothetical protein ACFYOV_32785 [Streptomyces sp. NPDC005931]|uniref:hypothetical protein n=1 Tax=Streptomyces sp. NPDC005931 TaxID=3364737 RepID=UPI0036A7A028